MKNFIKALIPYLPQYIRNKLSKLATNKKISQHKERKKRVHIKISEVENILDKLNLTKDIIIHSSLSNIGKIEGGGVKLTEMLLDKINLSEATLLAPALPFLGPSAEYLDRLELFDLSTAKNAMGNIPNQIMKKEGCLRSFHPTHSVIAIGAKSQSYIENHESSQTPFCSKSPYYKITKNSGKILMFGVGLNSITNFHVYEDILADYLPFNVYAEKNYQVRAINGMEEITIETKVHDLRMSAKRDCERARKQLNSNGFIETYQIGDSEISLLDAKGLTITLLQMLLKGESIYGKVKVTPQQKKIISEKLHDLN